MSHPIHDELEDNYVPIPEPQSFIDLQREIQPINS
jgi:hypothetical protein